MNGCDAKPSWIVVQVDDLPWPHFPFRCRWRREFDAATTDDFGEFVRGLTPGQLAECGYHDGSTDWAVAARIAVALVEYGDTDPDDRYVRAATHSDATACAIESFFSHPIHLDGDELGGGQHRVCAMKLAGVDRCPIEI